MDLTSIPEYVDIAKLAVLFDSDPKRTREMVYFLRNAGYGIEVIPWGTNGRRKKYSYPQFKRALLDYATIVFPQSSI